MYMVCLQGGAVCVTPGSSSSGELLLSLRWTGGQSRLDCRRANNYSVAVSVGKETTALVSVNVRKATTVPVSVSEYQEGNNC